jgi:carotenoid 1,2-hydratase
VWRVPRSTRADGPARVTHDLEDTPFYTRSRLATTLGGRSIETMHESLDLNRFAAPWVQRLLPFRTPRRVLRRA